MENYDLRKNYLKRCVGFVTPEIKNILMNEKVLK